jgi:hypothetical protein
MEYIPSAITDFAASDNLVGEIQFTWTNADGVPEPTYDIMDGTTLLASNVSSGYTHNFTYNYRSTFHVIAKNHVGSTPSNTNEGYSAVPAYSGPPSPVYVTGNNTVVAGIDFPSYTDINVCVVGGGGGGHALDDCSPLSQGGGAGQLKQIGLNLPYNESVSVTIGAGGQGRHSDGGSSTAGGSSSFGSYTTASGGCRSCSSRDGGTYVSPCDGNTYSHGTSSNCAYGGEASAFGNGGRGDCTGTAGGIGAGGGAGSCNYGGGQDGGRGQVMISWS